MNSSQDNLTAHNQNTLNDLYPGDLIEFYRGVYSHWGVYLGKGKIGHLAGEDNDGINAKVKPSHMFTISGVRFNKAKVTISDFWEVVDQSKAFKNNSRDSTWKPLHPDEIINNVMDRIGQVGYSLVYQNCEHFAKGCRYGIEKSDQVDNVVTGAAVGFAAALTVGVVGAIAKYMKGTPQKEEEEEEDQ